MISLDRIADSLKQFDNVVIVLKGLNGDTLDVVYRGKVERATDVQMLKAPHWDGGKVIVSITGERGGMVVYKVETRLDPATNTHDGIVVFVSPDASLLCTVQALTLLIGDSLPLPPVTVLPENLADKTLDWKSEPTGLMAVGPGFIKAAQPGTGTLTVALKNKSAVKLSISVTIAASGSVPESILVKPDTLEVAAAGAYGYLTATVSPIAAFSAVYWTSTDTSIATVDTAGRVHGKRQGETTVSATSKVRPSVAGSARIKVKGPVPVQSIAFAKTTLDILVGGAAESLMVAVLPPDADPSVTFVLSDPAKASLQRGKISGTAAGTVTVVAASVSNPVAKDTLTVTITVPTLNDTVPPGKPTVRVNPVSPTRELRPVWSWASGGGGAGSYQIILDKNVFDSSAIALSDTLFKPAANLAAGVHYLYVRERDGAGNWSLSSSAQVKIDTSGPTAPKIFGTSPTSTAPRWTWSTGGGGGSGIFRSRLGDANFTAGSPELTDSLYALPGATSGTTYILYVQERDAAGNWSPAANLPIKYDWLFGRSSG